MATEAGPSGAIGSIDALAREIVAIGERLGLPYVAASADISSPEAMVGDDGAPLVETIFRWVNPAIPYWRDRAFALRAPFITVARYMAEPVYYAEGLLKTWRPTDRLASIDAREAADAHAIAGAIIAPVHLPGGVIAAVVWATPEPTIDVAAIFAAHAAELHALSLKLMAAYHETRGLMPETSGAKLTRREIQCLKWAALGKTDQVIAELIHISAPTVRFHLKNAAQKLGVVGRAQAVREASALGYVGGPQPSRRSDS